MELYDDPHIVGKKMVVIRWNPHFYKVPIGKQKQTLEQRLEMMIKLKMKLRKNPPDNTVSLYYICYSRNNPLICQNITVALLYDLYDVDNIP
jgi:hypothetical protein